MSRNREIRDEGGERLSDNLTTDFGATCKLGTFFHGEHLGFDVARDFGLIFQLTTMRSDFALDFTEDFHFTSGDIAFDLGILADRHFAFVRCDLTFNFAIDDHVIRKTNGADDFNSGGEDVGSI
jgi:hypothetical protein